MKDTQPQATGIIGPNGKLVTEDRAEKIRQAFQCLMALTDDERGLALCWFCRGCNRHVGPGDHCTCMRDE